MMGRSDLKGRRESLESDSVSEVGKEELQTAE